MLSQTLAQVVHGEFSSADATALSAGTTARIVLHGPGSTSALTLDANDYVQILSATVSSAATTALVQIYDGADATVDAGEEIFGGIVPTNSTVSANFHSPHVCQKGSYPKVKASAAGNVRVQIRCVVVRAGS